ncbi:uncharacterized protein [Oryza sativa Japonica Group]|uniref:uncharacterized protein n=1 Tax=Oryza sativa subsp. japonica TaxID=39947 RepID=UPI00339CE87B
MLAHGNADSARRALQPSDGVGELPGPEFVGEAKGRDLPSLILHQAPQVGKGTLSLSELARQPRAAGRPAGCQVLLPGLQFGSPRRYRRALSASALQMPGLAPSSSLLALRKLLAQPAQGYLAAVYLGFALGECGVPFPARLLPQP